MRSVKSILVFVLFSLSATYSCTKNDDSNNPPGSGVTPAIGTWKITYFFDKKDETGNYSGYTFDFGANGALSATNGSQTWSGSWTTGVDDSANKVVIDFSSGTIPSALNDLEEDWLIIEVTDSFMHYEHTSGGNGDTDVVHFTKI